MASILPDYEYDIFISYRQNDNRHDGWVTEFVNNLKGELESSFKENISVYFDDNPSDRLLETYNVNKSLEVKLRSFIFIPIISRTYCDPKSYAWQYELLSFIKLCKSDQYGSDIRLRNGNFAGRILPVRVHELDPEDVRLFEKETGSMLRPVDFVFKTAAGVNRPLRANEDHPGDNLNKTYYRDQINKVANAITEIFLSLNKKQQKTPEKRSEDVSSVSLDTQVSQAAGYPEEEKGLRTKRIFVLLVLVMLFIAGAIAVISHNEKRKSFSEPERSIAVLPFRNDSPNDTSATFIDGLMEDLLTDLQMIKDLRVISRPSVEQYRNSTKSIPQIAKEQNVNYVVVGSGQKIGNSFTINVHLVRAAKEKQLWAQTYGRKINSTSDIFELQNKIALSIVSELNATITPEEKRLIEKVHTTSLNAYDFYQKGLDEQLKFWVDNDNLSALENSLKLFRKALEFDPTFAEAYASEARSFWSLNVRKDPSSEKLDSVLFLANLALRYYDKLPDAYYARGSYWDTKGMKDKALEEYKKALEVSPNYWMAYAGIAFIYMYGDQLMFLDNMKKATMIDQSGPLASRKLKRIGGKLEATGFKDDAMLYYKKALDLDKDSSSYLSALGDIESNHGNYDKSIYYYKRAYPIREDSRLKERLGEAYQLQGQDKESLEYFKEYIKLNPDSKNPMIAYAYWQNGLKKEADLDFNELLEHYKNLVVNNVRFEDINMAYYYLACIYAFKGDKETAFKYLKIFSQNKYCENWMISHLKNDRLLSSIRNEPEYSQIETEMETNYEAVHERVGKWLEKQRNP
jgi:TolB-like protein